MIALDGHALGNYAHRPRTTANVKSRTCVLPIASITVGTRYRYDMGDLAALSESIAAEGLLQPIAVTEAHELVAGERRLRACEKLGWTEIAVHVVSVTSIVAGEYAENIIRKDFTASERLKLADAIRDAIGNRQGQRTDVGAKKRPGDIPEVPRGTETRVVTAKLAGFGNEKTMADARAVVEQGAPELVQAMDAGTIPVSVAKELLALPPEKQVAVISDGRLRVQEVARELRRDKARQREAVVPRVKITEIAEGTYPCTFPGCARGVDDPFTNAGALANHRFASHQIRSTNFESAQRQARRDRQRREREVQDQAAKGVRQSAAGALDRGEREMLRKRIQNVCVQYANEIHRSPAEVYRALSELLTDDITRPLTASRIAPVDPDRTFATGAR